MGSKVFFSRGGTPASTLIERATGNTMKSSTFWFSVIFLLLVLGCVIYASKDINRDTDGDGLRDHIEDEDDDNDGILDVHDEDDDGDGIPDTDDEDWFEHDEM